MAFDFKKEDKELYGPKPTPSIVLVPKMKYLAIRGSGNPNEENGEYKKTIELLYTVLYTIKMSYKGTHKIEGFFEFVAPPLEGLWWQDGCSNTLDYQRKDAMQFISLLRVPDFVTEDVVQWAKKEATKKKKRDFSQVKLLTYEEGFCVQCLHLGSYNQEPETIEKMHEFIKNNGYELDITPTRYHHELYLSNPERCQEEKMKTIIRHPIKKKL